MYSPLPFSSFFYRRKRPFHPERFLNWLENWPIEVVRAKGFFWLASRNDMCCLLSQAGTSITIQGAGQWVATYPEEAIREILQEDDALRTNWDNVYGDRMTEFVLIGIEMDARRIEATLDECLLTDDEMKEDWTIWKDPFPPFHPSL
ncbi:hypothetical protein B9L21_01710 [Geobacillus uzenensis]|uniref:CobW C-terminal domain-containing protein n=1 Tax=Geobacillus uzenensis TaxID=129339 RepID=A0ABX4DJW1_9BACL|nr:hypothetical protein B9L21_01710 [Geobacillus uzenensis]